MCGPGCEPECVCPSTYSSDWCRPLVPQGETDGVYIWHLGEWDAPVAHFTDNLVGNSSQGFHNRLSWSPDGQVCARQGMEVWIMYSCVTRHANQESGWGARGEVIPPGVGGVGGVAIICTTSESVTCRPPRLALR